MLHCNDAPHASQEISRLRITPEPVRLSGPNNRLTQMSTRGAHRFHQTRAAHLAESAEDYTELVLDLITECGEARVTELARRLGISHVTALRTVKRLTTAGLLVSGRRSPITLTPKGRRLALRARRKHQALVAFLQRLGVPLDIAESDAEGIEHHISGATLRAILRWMKKGILALVLAATLSQHASALSESPCARVQSLAPAIAGLRNLPLKNPVICKDLSPEQFRTFKEKQLLESTTSAQLNKEQVIFSLLGLIPNSYPYTRCIARSNTSDVVASYDADSRAIILQSGLPVSDEMLAHEITHALQDQHYNLRQLQLKANRFTDSALSLSALCEGDALDIQDRFVTQQAAIPRAADQPEIQATPPQHDECALPELLDQQNGFPYERGRRFIALLEQTHGEGFRDRMFRHPPQTTHEILIPGDYPLKEGENTLTLQTGDESLGEFTISLLLRQYLPLNKALLAAKGWRGDRARLSTNAQGQILEWSLIWNTAADADDFFRAYNHGIALRFKTSIREDSPSFELIPSPYMRISAVRSDRLITYRFQTPPANNS